MAKKKSGKQINKRLYECDDCKERRMVSWVEQNRAGRPKCFGCGSTRLVLVSAEAVEDMHRLQDERLKGDHGSFKLGMHRTHREVL